MFQEVITISIDLLIQFIYILYYVSLAFFLVLLLYLTLLNTKELDYTKKE